MRFAPLLTCLAATFYLVGLIWVIQLVHYPLFERVGVAEFPQYHAEHSGRITLVLSLPFLLSVGSTMLMFSVIPNNVPGWSVWLNAALTAAMWVVTGIVQLPLHAQLEGGYSAAVIQTLTNSNWLRTAILTAQGLLLLWMTLRGVEQIA